MIKIKKHIKRINKKLDFNPKSSQKIKRLAFKKLVGKVKNVS